jgi:hypothetical protein
MPNRIILRNSTTPGAVPSAASLQPAEVAINAADGSVFTLLSDNTTVRTLIPSGGVNGSRVGAPAWSASMTINWKEQDLVRVTLGGASTVFTFSGAADGQKLILELTQDATGGRAITLPGTVRYSTTIPSISLSTAAGKLDRLGFIYHAPSNSYDLVAAAIGY